MFAPGLSITFAKTMTEKECRDYISTFPEITIESFYDKIKSASINVPSGKESEYQYNKFDKSKVVNAQRRVYLQPR
jgi:hypothetical protein